MDKLWRPEHAFVALLTHTRCATIRVDVIGILRIIGGYVTRTLFLACGGALAVAAARFGSSYDPAGPGFAALAFPLFTDSLVLALYPAVLLGFGASLLRLVFVARGRVVARFLLVLVAFAMFTAVFGLAPTLRDLVPLRSGRGTPVVRAGGVTRFPDADVLPGSRERFSLLDVVLFSREEPRGFSFVSEGFIDPFERNMEIPLPDRDLSIDLDSAESGPTVVFRPPALLSAFADTVERSSERFTSHYASNSTLFWMETGAIILAMAGSWAFAHMSRWPLLNGVGVCFVALSLPAIHVLLYDPDVMTLYEQVLAEDLVFAAPTLALLAVGLALRVLGLLFPSVRRIRPELEE